jgi:membrane protein DedA with SNARE-associated domain/rhodanese-related sulfurtransferase
MELCDRSLAALNQRMTGTLDLLASHSVWLVFAITLAARLGAPVPAAPLLVLVGGLAVTAQLAFWPAMAAGVLANVLGDGVWFLAGRRYGHRMMRLLCRISMSPDSCVRQSEAFIEKWGGSSLIAAKFIPGISVVAAPMAGALGMTARMFLGYELLAAGLWTFGFALIGVAFSRHIDLVLQWLSTLGAAAAAALGAVLLMYLAVRWFRRRLSRRERAIPRVSVAELAAWLASENPPLVIDVRSATSRQLDPRRVPGAQPLDLKQLAAHTKALASHGRRIVVYCNCPNDASAAHAARLLMQSSEAEVLPLGGGLDAWVAAGFTTEQHDALPPDRRMPWRARAIPAARAEPSAEAGQ